jgi:hypothetical protein
MQVAERCWKSQKGPLFKDLSRGLEERGLLRYN